MAKQRSTGRKRNLERQRRGRKERKVERRRKAQLASGTAPSADR